MEDLLLIHTKSLAAPSAVGAAPAAAAPTVFVDPQRMKIEMKLIDSPQQPWFIYDLSFSASGLMLSIFASATESGSGGCKALCIVWPDMDNGSGQQSGDKPVRLVYYRKTVARVIGKKNVRFLIQFTVVGLRTASVYLDHISHLATTKAATAAGPTSNCKKPVSRPSISARSLEYP